MKKRKLIYFLIISVVILSLFLASFSFGVSAATSNDVTYTYSGDELLDFLNLYTVEVYASDYPDLRDPQLVPNDVYQAVFAKGKSDVYLVLNFPDTSDYYIKDKALRVRFRSRIVDENGQSLVYFKNFSTTLYKRIVTNNGDFYVDDGESEFQSYFSGSLELGSYESGYFVEYYSNLDNTEVYTFPYLNGYTDSSTGYYYIREEAPFASVISGNSYYNRWIFGSAYRMDMIYNASANGLEYDLLQAVNVNYKGNGYSAGAIMVGFTPITITTTEPDFTTIQGFLGNMTGDQITDIGNKNDSFTNSKDYLEESGVRLDGYDEFINTNTDLPEMNLDFILDLENTGGMFAALDAFGTSMFNINDTNFVYVVMLACVPPLLVSYLIYGRK